METSSAVEMPTLYERLGNLEGITTLVDDIVEAHMCNPVISPRFLPYREKPEELAKVKQHLCYFFAAGCGGPEAYIGRSMPEAHRGMNISEAEYMAALDDILAVLERHNVDEETRNAVLVIGYALKGEIMKQ